tara:strand:+ start:427 stop:744 length:318 start_codon:yes stop_codon:yes gene_type:complete
MMREERKGLLWERWKRRENGCSISTSSVLVDPLYRTRPLHSSIAVHDNKVYTGSRRRCVGEVQWARSSNDTCDSRCTQGERDSEGVHLKKRRKEEDVVAEIENGH